MNYSRTETLTKLVPARWRQPHRRRYRHPTSRPEGVMRFLLMSWTAFRIGNLPVQFHFTCLFHPVGFLLWMNREAGWLRNMVEVTVILLLLWASLLVHEWAHILAARRIVVTPLGAMAHLDSMPRGAGEIWIALAGPASSFVLAGIFWFLRWLLWSPHLAWLLEAAGMLQFGYVLNLLLAGFNLLPCYPMDGGRVLRALLALALEKFAAREPEEAHVTASRITVRCVVPVMVALVFVVTVFHTHMWIHLFLFPLLWLIAEMEYRFLLDQ